MSSRFYGWIRVKDAYASYKFFRLKEMLRRIPRLLEFFFGGETENYVMTHLCLDTFIKKRLVLIRKERMKKDENALRERNTVYISRDKLL